MHLSVCCSFSATYVSYDPFVHTMEAVLSLVSLGYVETVVCMAYSGSGDVMTRV